MKMATLSPLSVYYQFTKDVQPCLSTLLAQSLQDCSWGPPELTDTETMGEASNEAPWDNKEDAEDIIEASHALAENPGKF